MKVTAKSRKEGTTAGSDAPSYAEWARDVLPVPAHDRAEFIRRSLRSKAMLHVFGRYFFPNVIRGDEDEVPECHRDLIRELARPESSACVYPRGFAKSTWEKIDTLHDIVYALEPLIVFYGATSEDVGQSFEWVKGELETNRELVAVYGSLVPQVGKPGTKWTNKHIRAANGVNVMGRGAGKGRGFNVGGHRPTKVIIDDGETDEMVRSSVRREKYWRWITEVVEPGLDPERGRLKTIGTVIHPKCAVKRFQDERGGIFRRAIEDGESIWPGYWSLERLHRLRDGWTKPDGKRVLGIGTRAFSQELLNTPLAEGLAMFPARWLEDNTFEHAELPRAQELDVVMAVDPAAGEGSSADDYGACVIGRHRGTGKRYVLASSRYQGPIGSAVMDRDGNKVRTGARKWFHEIYVRWQPRVCGVEASMTVCAFWQMVRDSGEYRLQKLAPSAGVGRRNASKEERAKLVVPHVEGGMVLFDPAQADLYDQLTSFPSQGVKDDVADGFFHANSLLDAGSATIDVESQRSQTGTTGIRDRKF